MGTRLLMPPCFTLNRESFRTFHELSEIFSDENNHSLSRELLIKVPGAQSLSHNGPVSVPSAG